MVFFLLGLFYKRREKKIEQTLKQHFIEFWIIKFICMTHNYAYDYCHEKIVFMLYAASVYSDKPAHQCILVRSHHVRKTFHDLIAAWLGSSWQDCREVQAGLHLRWPRMAYDPFSYDAGQIRKLTVPTWNNN